MGTERKTITDFGHPLLLRWSSVNDVVMGGLSESLLQVSENGTGIFAGHLSLENNGGFASARASLSEHDFSGYDGIVIRVNGDGKQYSFRVRTDMMFDGLVYRHDFDTKAGEWMEMRMPFSDFQPSFRGRIVSDVPQLDPARIFQIGFLISQKQEGAFRLEVERIEAYGL